MERKEILESIDIKIDKIRKDIENLNRKLVFWNALKKEMNR